MLRTTLLALSLLLAATGCRSDDRDDDGYDETEDCDDLNNQVHPGADELCDGVDNDCDGAVDEDDALDKPGWFVDADADGYGDPGEAIWSCNQPMGTVDNDLDCNDEDAEISPAAEEYCDEVDNDCDGTVDEADAVDVTTFYADADADGYGTEAYTTEACSVPDGYADNADDCDDLHAEASPEGTEVCDGLDNDCNGEIDDGSLDPVTWYQDVDLDGYGDPASTLLTCTGPEGYVLDGTDCNDGDAAVHPEADEYCDGVDTDCDGTLDEDDALDATTWYVDLDADGYGTADATTQACAQPDGYAATPDDCDDASADVNPAATELCDGVDNDCDGTTDDDATDKPTWYIDYDGDGYGSTRLTASACEAPTNYVDNADDCNDWRAEAYPGATEVCDDLDNNCDGNVDELGATGGSTFYADTDGDGYGDAGSTIEACDAPSGYVSNDDDCDDGAAGTYPGASEYCDDADNDCDGSTDEGAAVDAPTWYIDYDGDGYGSTRLTSVACDAPTNYVANDDDCNDWREEAYPGASEYCDGIDNDCDGSTDEAGAVDAPTWYADDDGDSFGDPATSAVACSAPSGYVGNDEDCNDALASANPDADEYCNGTDDDCDGVTDEASALDATVWYRDSDTDGYGNAAAATYACTVPSGYAAVAGDCNDTNDDINPGATEVCDSADNDCDGVVDEADASDAITWYQDSDRDTYGNSSVSTRACTSPSGYVATGSDCDDGDADVYPGALELCNDGVDNDCDGILGPCAFDLADADYTFMGVSSGDYAGTALAACGDLNDDGADDIAIGAEYVDLSYTQVDAGATYVFYGPFTSGTVDVTTADVVLLGEAAGDQSGTALAGGMDVNGDGVADLLVAGKKNQAGIGTATGAAYLFLGPISAPSSSLSDADAKFSGNSIYDFAGIYLASAGDVDDDGFDDLLVTANNDDPGGRGNAGTVYLINGRASPGDISLTNADLAFQGETAYDYAGFPASAGDVDGDGLADVVIGVSTQDVGGTSTDAGRVYLVFGDTISGTSASSMVLSAADIVFTGTSSGDALGTCLAPAGDPDGDGYDDFLVSATRADTGTNNAGAVYLVEGPLTGVTATNMSVATTIIVGAEPDEHAGGSLDAGVDFDGDGALDYLVGAADLDDAGGAYLFLGPLAGTVSVLDADAAYLGADENDQAGSAVRFPGDVQGTGDLDAVFIAARYNDDGGSDAGAAYLVFGLTE